MILEVALLAGAGGATLSRLIAKEEGPFKMFARFQVWATERARAIEAKHPQYAELVASALDLLACPICQSVWWGGLLALALGVAAGLAPIWIAACMLGAPAIAWAIGEQGRWM